MTDLNDLLVTSPDLNNERVETLKQMFPDLFSNEGKLNPLELKRIFEDEVTTDREQYTFTWKGKGNAKRHAFSPSKAALTYDPKRSVNPDRAKGNMIIEGENLEVLKLLTSAYREQIKCILIDPPYNKDADTLYRDNYSVTKKEYWEENGSYRDGVKLDTNPETSGRHHSDWLSMVYGRLLIARQLLSDDGVIFIHTDNNEVHNLRSLMDEIFGEENFIECITWNKRVPKNDKGIGNIHEYILVYVKKESLKHEFLMPKEGLAEINGLLARLKRKRTPIPEAEEAIRKLYEKRGYDRGITLYNSLNEDYRLWGKINMSWPNANTFGPRYTVKHPRTGLPVKIPDRGWRWKAETFNEAANIVDGDYKSIVELHDGSLVCGKIWFDKDEGTQPSSINFLDEVDKLLLRSVISLKSDGGIEVEKIFEGKSFFSYPKPTSLTKLLLRSVKLDENDIILDFFAGSGTTAHSVMRMNQEDGKNLQFILVQLPEALDKDKDHEAYKAGYRTISQLTIERCKRVVQGYSDSPQPLDTGFKVYRLTKSHFPRAEFQPDPNKSNEESIELLKQYINEKEASFQITFDQDDVVDEVLLKHGFKLNYKLIRQEGFGSNTVFLAEEGDRKAYVCLDTSIASETIDFFKAHKDTTFICLERALDTTKKWNLKHNLGERLKAL
jgi:adenine-specific DNA-methyltransferase